MTHEDVRTWLDAYVDAWRSYDPAAIADLFTEDATYAYHPWDEGEAVVRGRDAIVADWLEEQDPPDSWEAQYRPIFGRRPRGGCGRREYPGSGGDPDHHRLDRRHGDA